MKKKTFLTILTISFILNIIWAFGYAYLTDFHPEMKGFIEVFGVKAIVNGGINLIVLMVTPSHWRGFKD